MNNSTKHILILGSTGFIGKAFMEELTNEKEVWFHILIHSKTLVNHFDNATYYKGSLTTFDWQSLSHTPDVVYHFARLNSTRGKSLGRKWVAYKGSKANLKLINYLHILNKKVRLFYLSGSLMYGNSSLKIDEDSVLNPISFAKEYYKAEKPFIDFQNKKSMLEITLVRVPWVLGNGSWFESFYKSKLLLNEVVPVYGKGDNIMSFIMLSDLTKCLVFLLKLNFQKTIHICYNQTLTQNEFVELIALMLKLKIKEIELNGFESAIKEAFQSNILLSSKFNFFDKILENSPIKEKVTSELRFIFKDI